jgi:glycosyltransferase involved in cell wall biosynthesis
MRILFLSAHPAMSLSDSQGYVTRILELIGGLAELGHEVFPLIAGDQKARQTAQKVYKHRVKRLVPPKIAQVVRELTFLFLDRQYYSYCQREVKRVQPDVILERYSVFHRTGMWLATRFGLPLVLDDIAPLWEEDVYFRRGLPGVARRIQEQVFARADGLIAVSGAMKSYLIQNGVPEHKVTVIHNAADHKKFAPDVDGSEIRERYGLADKTVVGFVGAFLPWHGIESLINVALDLKKKNERMRFLLVGPDNHWMPESSSFKQMTANVNGMVVFTGPVPHKEVPKHVAAMDIATMPKSNNYGSPIKIFEYMAAGKSVIAPRLPPIEEIITHGQDGWLVDMNDLGNLNNAIEYLGENPQVREKIGIRARETVIRNFTWLNQARLLECVFAELTKA